jgi:hypothetical protein
MNICNFRKNATPKLGMHLGVIGLHPLHSPLFWPHGPLHSTFSHKLNVSVMTLVVLG